VIICAFMQPISRAACLTALRKRGKGSQRAAPRKTRADSEARLLGGPINDYIRVVAHPSDCRRISFSVPVQSTRATPSA
jgi:hypothetical protein